MKFGVCCGAGRFAAVKRAGYDYIEAPLCDIAAMDAAAFAEYRARLREYALAAETFNCFFPGGMRLVGEEADRAAVAAYADRALARAAMLGGKIAVVGSGKARHIPNCLSRERAEEQLVEMLRTLGAAAAKNGMKIALEPLCRAETNMIHTVAEGRAFVGRVGDPHVGCLADIYHMARNGEDFAVLAQRTPPLLHVHLARADADRRMPIGREDAPLLSRVAALLRQAGYDARMSLEGSFEPDFEAVITALRPRLCQFNEGERTHE